MMVIPLFHGLRLNINYLPLMLCISLFCGCQTQRSFQLDEGHFTLKDLEEFYQELRLARRLYDNEIYSDEQIVQLVQYAAERGHDRSQHVMGVLYYEGRHVKKNMQESRYWLLKAANANHAKAQYLLGQIYANGLGIEQDFAIAENWFIKSATNGNLTAKLALADYYLKGFGGFHSNEKAFELYKELAETGSPHAQYYMGKFYMYGRMVDKDLQKAAHWFKKAANQNFQPAVIELRKLIKMNSSTNKEIVM